MTITLNEEKARLWLAQQADAADAGGDCDVFIAEDWEPRDAGEESTVYDLLWNVQQQESPIIEGLDGRSITFVYDYDSDGGAYFFYVDFPSGVPYEPLRVASPYVVEMRKLGTPDVLGIDAAIDILQEAVQQANAIQQQLNAYVATKVI